MTTGSRDDRSKRTGGEDAWIAVVAEHTEWGERSPNERAALRATIEERIEAPGRGARGRAIGTAIGTVAAAAIVLALFVLPGGPRPAESPLGRGFLSAAYYDGDASLDRDDSHLPQDFQIWSEALDLTAEGEAGTSS